MRHVEFQLTPRIFGHFTIDYDPPRRDVKQRFRTRLKDDSPTCRELSVEGAFGEPDAVQSEIAGMGIFHVLVDRHGNERSKIVEISQLFAEYSRTLMKPLTSI